MLTSPLLAIFRQEKMLTLLLSKIWKSSEKENVDIQSINEIYKAETSEADNNNINIFSRRFEGNKDGQKISFGGVLDMFYKVTYFAN